MQKNYLKDDIEYFANIFKDRLIDLYSEDGKFEDIPFIKAFLKSAIGFEKENPIHYPRKGCAPEGENFRWFVENERSDRFSLESLTEEDNPFPYFDES